MQHYVFNGDADGLCALQQLRLAEPADAVLITGVKRDLALLNRVRAESADRVTVLDVALDCNLEALLRLLERNVTVRYFDHHVAQWLPTHPKFESYIDTTADKGTSLLVDQYLEGRFRAWALVGTFGDNFDHRARNSASSMNYTPEQIEALQMLGILLNYNSYGTIITDLHLAPDVLADQMLPYQDPLEFIALSNVFTVLRDGYNQDMAEAASLRPQLVTDYHCLYLMPNEPWTRRISGVLANQLAQANPQRAHAIVTYLPTDGFLVSVRAPLLTPIGADVLCRQFATGGGRKAAAGINRLPAHQYQAFIHAFANSFGG